MIPLRMVMSGLYASEINCGIQSFWDGEWQAWVGDEMNGIKAEDFSIPFDGLGEWLHETALRLYPASEYAKRWMRTEGLEGERESVDDVLSIVESYGPWGTDINESLRFQIVLADEVRKLRVAREAFKNDSVELQHDLDVANAELARTQSGA